MGFCHLAGMTSPSWFSIFLPSFSTSSWDATPVFLAAASVAAAERRSISTPIAAVRAGSRLASWSRRSSKAASAAVPNAIASWISKSFVTRWSLTPRPYSTGTRATKRRSCWARRADSAAVKGAAVKPSSAWSISAAGGGGGLAVAALGGAAELGERARRGLLGGRAAVLPVARGEDLPVAGGLGGGLGLAGGETLLARGVRVLEQLALPRLVGVEQVLGDRQPRGGGRQLPAREAGDGIGAVGAGRVKRVAVRKSRSSSHERVVAASPRPAAASVTA